MLPVSATWKEAIKQQFRYQGYLRVVIQVTPPGLQENMQIATANSESVSNIDVLTDEDGLIPTPYISLETNRWVLNKRYKVLPDNVDTDDWWATPMSFGDKVLDFVFDQTYSVPGVYFEWDLVNNSYPTKLLIEGYDNLNTKIYSLDVTNISSPKGFVDLVMDDVKRVVVTIQEWSRPTWRPRINEVLFGMYDRYDSINNGRIISAESVDSSYPLNDELPIHTISVDLRNIDQYFDPSLSKGIAKYLDKRQLIQYSWGFTTSYGVVEWTPYLSYYVEEFKIPKDSKDMSISATSRLAFLTDSVKNVTYTGNDRTLYDLAVEILQKSKIIKNTKNEIPWQLSDKLKEYTTSAPAPVQAVNTVLQLIASAAGLQLYVHPVTGFVCIESFSDLPVHEVTKQQEIGDPEITIQEVLRSVKIGVTNYSKSSEDKEQIGEITCILKGVCTLEIDYNCSYAIDVTCSVSNATLLEFTPFGSSAEVKLDAGTTEVEVKVTLNGYKVSSNTTYIETYKNELIDYGLDVQVENLLITNTNRLQDLTDNIVAVYSKQQKQSVEYTGYPELTAGDCITLETEYTSGKAKVLQNNITFDGGFNGVLEVR